MITSAPAPRVDEADAPLPRLARLPRPHRALFLTGAAALGTVAALVLARSTGLWLDEAQSVAIARLPLGDLLQALKHDGSPPLYYLLLHGWIRLFGTGDTAVRALSAVFAVATVPLVFAAGQRTLGRRGAVIAGTVAVSSPFFYRYATEARMYSLVFLLVAAAWLAAERAWRGPTPARLAAVALTGGLLALTHYWALFLVIPAIAVLVARRRWDLLGALAAGAVLFVPWLPAFAFQMAHTGAPWGPPANVDLYEFSLRGFAGGPGRLGLLGLLYFALAALAVVGRPDGGEVRIDIRGTALGGRLALAVLVPLSLGLAVSALGRSAFAFRYAAIVFVPFVVLIAHGLQLVRPAHLVRVAAAVVVALGVWRSVVTTATPRSQAPSIAKALNAQAQPGDLVIYCPDQLGVGVARLLHTPAATEAYPTKAPGDIVDWVDYRARNHAARPLPFAREASAATTGAVWLVTSPGYRTFGEQCGHMYTELTRLRPGGERVVKSKRSSYEHASLWRFPAVSRGAS
jgi:hypothetical protein